MINFFKKLFGCGSKQIRVSYDAESVTDRDSLTIKEYSAVAASTAKYPVHQGLFYTALGLNGEAGEVAELVKRVIRDDDGLLTEERRQQLKKELGDVFWYLVMTAQEAGLEPSEIAQANMEKLAARHKKGLIQGQGSDR